MTAPAPAVASTASAPLPRRWLYLHLASVAVIGAVLVVAGRGQWFFFDEWDFLASRAEWALLAPHNGHLSFFPQLLTTLVKSVFGLHSYWPFLALVIIAHLVVVHMLWRVMMRTAVAPAIAIAVTFAFGVLSAGTDNTLWAFQVGFVTPIATGAGALLLAMRPVVDRRATVWISVFLIVGVGFASTGLPLAFAVLVFLFVRHGWRAAVVPAVAFAAVYGLWYLVFARGTTGADGLGADSLGDILIGMPQFIAHGFVDSLAKTLPLAALAPALLVALVIGAVLDLRRQGVRGASPAYWLAVAAVVFSLLTAYTRVASGVENASAGRYVYIYAALLAPLVARLLTLLAGRSRVAITIVCALVLVLAATNAAQTVREGRNQALLEQTVNRTISAALTIDDGSAEMGARTPAARVAPTLTMFDVREFVARGQYSPVEFTDTDLLDAKINLLLTAEPAPDASDVDSDCAVATDGWVAIDPRSDVLIVPHPGVIDVRATDGDVESFGTRLRVESAGANELTGWDSSVKLELRATDAGGVCVAER